MPQFTWDGMRQADGPVCLSEQPSPLDSQPGWGLRPLGTAGPNLAAATFLAVCGEEECAAGCWAAGEEGAALAVRPGSSGTSIRMMAPPAPTSCQGQGPAGQAFQAPATHKLSHWDVTQPPASRLHFSGWTKPRMGRAAPWAVGTSRLALGAEPSRSG